MLLCINIGNTNTECGLFKENRIIKYIITRTKRFNVNYFAPVLTHLRQNRFGIVYCSVVPEVTKLLTQTVPRLNPQFIDELRWNKQKFIKIKYRPPDKLGTDRIANAIAVKVIYGTPAIVIDGGTAITVDCIDTRANFIGGMILPGPDTAAKSLTDYTAQLPLVAFNFKSVPNPTGNNTRRCIQSGLYYGYLGAIEKIVAILKPKLGTNAVVISTGGLGKFYYHKIKGIDAVVPDLTLHGLRIFGKRNYGY